MSQALLRGGTSASFPQPCQVSSVFISSLCMREPGHRQVKTLTLNRTASSGKVRNHTSQSDSGLTLETVSKWAVCGDTQHRLKAAGLTGQQGRANEEARIPGCIN